MYAFWEWSNIFQFLPVLAWCDHKIILQIKTKQINDHIMQELVKTGKFSYIKKQSDVKFWLNWIKFGAVSYLSSCNKKNQLADFIHFLSFSTYLITILKALLSRIRLWHVHCPRLIVLQHNGFFAQSTPLLFCDSN